MKSATELSLQTYQSNCSARPAEPFCQPPSKTHEAAHEKPTAGLPSSAVGGSMPAARPLSARAMVAPVEHTWPLLAIVGPTASGKSALGLALAEKTGGEILNYDSVQIYRGFTIGSGSIAREAQRGIPHHLLDVLDPGKVFTAGDYRREALRVLSGLRERGRLPVLVGGTGLYLRSLLQGLFEGPLRSEALRARLRQADARHGPSFLHRLLARRDAESA